MSRKRVEPCSTCAKRTSREVRELKAQVMNQQTALDALAEDHERALELCRTMAEWLNVASGPDWQDALTPEQRELWELVGPFGDEEGEDGADTDSSDPGAGAGDMRDAATDTESSGR